MGKNKSKGKGNPQFKQAAKNQNGQADRNNNGQAGRNQNGQAGRNQNRQAGNGQRNYQNGTQTATRYVGAPYNFVPYADIVMENYQSEAELPVHNEVQESLLSGDITFKLTAETPIFIGGGDGETFYRTISGAYAIPGSSIKGLIRNNMQILGRGSIADDVEDYNIMYRTVGNANSERTRYYKDVILGVKTISISEDSQITLPINVQAGYICNINGKYYIKETVSETVSVGTEATLNYYTLSEKTILDDKKEQNFKLNRSKLQNIKFEQKQQWDNRKRENVLTWVGTASFNYYPYCIAVYYKPSGRTVSSVYEIGEKFYSGEKPSDYKKGFLISTGPMNKKKHVYIIPEMSVQEGEKIDDKDVRAYQRDYEMKKNGLHGTRLRDPKKQELARDFFRLPKEGESRPVFYVRNAGRTYFGYTPYLRIFYEHSILDGLPDSQKDVEKPMLDYVRSILGFSSREDSYKTRVSFEDAPLENEQEIYSPVSVVLGEPKLSSFLDYLKQEREQETTYNDDFSFRGIKQYWLHESPGQGNVGNNARVGSDFCALTKGSCFNETIHFKNLREAELGLLLWCIYQGKDYQWNIGKAKAYGYGCVSVSCPMVKIYDLAKMYTCGLTLDVYSDDQVKIADYIDAYKLELREKLGLSNEKAVEELPGIKEFLAMKNGAAMPNPDRIRYMSIDNGEYQNRDRALPTVEEVLQEKEGKKMQRPARNAGRRGGNNTRINNEQRVIIDTINKSNGKEICAEFIKVDSRKKTMSVKIDGKEETFSVDAFKLLKYSGYKKGQKITIRKEKVGQGFRYEVAD